MEKFISSNKLKQIIIEKQACKNSLIHSFSYRICILKYVQIYITHILISLFIIMLKLSIIIFKAINNRSILYTTVYHVYINLNVKIIDGNNRLTYRK